MPTNSLVACPNSSERRVFLGIRRGLHGTEIRSFRCARCDVSTDYELRGRTVCDITAREQSAAN